jgi:hypothetical protein
MRMIRLLSRRRFLAGFTALTIFKLAPRNEDRMLTGEFLRRCLYEKPFRVLDIELIEAQIEGSERVLDDVTDHGSQEALAVPLPARDWFETYKHLMLRFPETGWFPIFSETFGIDTDMTPDEGPITRHLTGFRWWPDGRERGLSDVAHLLLPRDPSPLSGISQIPFTELGLSEALLVLYKISKPVELFYKFLPMSAQHLFMYADIFESWITRFAFFPVGNQHSAVFALLSPPRTIDEAVGLAEEIISICNELSLVRGTKNLGNFGCESDLVKVGEALMAAEFVHLLFS